MISKNNKQKKIFTHLCTSVTLGAIGIAVIAGCQNNPTSDMQQEQSNTLKEQSDITKEVKGEKKNITIDSNEICNAQNRKLTILVKNSTGSRLEFVNGAQVLASGTNAGITCIGIDSAGNLLSDSICSQLPANHPAQLFPNLVLNSGSSSITLSCNLTPCDPVVVQRLCFANLAGIADDRPGFTYILWDYYNVAH